MRSMLLVLGSVVLGSVALGACANGGQAALADAGTAPGAGSGATMPPAMPPTMPPAMPPTMTPVVTPDAGGQDATVDAGGQDAGADAGADAGTDAGDPCAGLLDACTTAGKECSGDVLVTCKKNADGCLVETRTNCLDVGTNNSCDGSLAKPACAYDPCKDAFGVAKPDACVVDATTCQGDILVECVPDADLCPIATRTNCKTVNPGTVNFCDDTLVPPACALDPCIGVTNCAVVGKSCRGTKLVDCADLAGCLVQTVTDCTAGGTAMQTCIPGAPPACGACMDDPACASTPACTGTASNTFETCTDTDGDMCLNLVTEDCGASFTCNMASGCGYSGGEVCDKMPLTDTLRAPGSYGSPYNTMGGTSNYGSYPCPGLLAGFPFLAAAPDHLFAVDVAPGTVVTVAFAAKFTGAWMLLLTDCSDAPTMTAESSCQDLSQTGITYTSEGTTTQRVYIIVDADGASAGMYGLTVDVRPLACGDGHLDGGEACDDGNLLTNDGCTPDCMLETDYKCTNESPSECTLRPRDGVCGNVLCPDLPSGAPSGSELCCTTEQLCGVAYPTYYGAGCFERDQAGAADTECANETSTFFYPTLQGCCQPDGQCGVLPPATAGMGCVERTEFWRYSEQGLASALYSGPFEAAACTP